MKAWNTGRSSSSWLRVPPTSCLHDIDSPGWEGASDQPPRGRCLVCRREEQTSLALKPWAHWSPCPPTLAGPWGGPEETAHSVALFRGAGGEHLDVLEVAAHLPRPPGPGGTSAPSPCTSVACSGQTPTAGSATAHTGHRAPAAHLCREPVPNKPWHNRGREDELASCSTQLSPGPRSRVCASVHPWAAAVASSCTRSMINDTGNDIQCVPVGP